VKKKSKVIHNFLKKEKRSNKRQKRRKSVKINKTQDKEKSAFTINIQKIQ